MKMLKYSLTCYTRLLKWLNKIYIKDKVLEDGYHQISIYDVDSRYLLLTYRITSYGKKDGEEIEYFEKSEDIKRKINWKNGQKDGEEIEYFKGSKGIKQKTNWKDGQKDGLEQVYTNEYLACVGDGIRILAENEYNKGILVNEKKYFYQIDVRGKGTFSKKLRQVIPASPCVSNMVADVIIENGKWKHITKSDWANGYQVVFDMEFKDGKMYNGWYGNNCYKEGRLTGTKVVCLEDSPCAEFIPYGSGYSGVKCWKSFDDGVFVSDDASYHWSDGFGGWNYKIHIPVNGQAYKTEAQDGLLWTFNMKDGKRDGEYHVGNIRTFYTDGKLNGVHENSTTNIRKTYKNGVLEGPYTAFFDKIDGKMKVVGFYKNGQKAGLWEYYAEDGTLLKQEYQQEGNGYETLKKLNCLKDRIRGLFRQR